MKTLLAKSIALALTGSLLGGCAISPELMDNDTRLIEIKQDLSKIFADQTPVEGTVSLGEAMARAIKYNLDHRLKLMEDALARGQLDVAQHDLLPNLTVAAGYSGRSNQAGASSQAIRTGLESLESSTSQERSRNTADLTFTWNILDFGVSHAQAKQQADNVLISEERRRKVIQNIIQDVRFAYWRAVSAQRLLGSMDKVLERAHSALTRARKLENLRLQQPLQTLNYQKGLLEIIRQMWSLREELASARTELAALMNLKPGTPFTLPIPDDIKMVVPVLKTEVESLEQQALLLRPELREEHYQARVSANEVRKAMLRMLPGLEITLGEKYDSNRFLYNNDWGEAGLRISWNLFNVFSGPASLRAAEAEQDLTETRRLALSMAVLTQVRLSHQRYHIAVKNYEVAKSLVGVEKRIQRHMQAEQKAATENELEVIRSLASALAAQMQHDLAFAEVQNAMGRIYNSAGIDPLPTEVDSHDLPTLAEAIEKKINEGL